MIYDVMDIWNMRKMLEQDMIGFLVLDDFKGSDLMVFFSSVLLLDIYVSWDRLLFLCLLFFLLSFHNCSSVLSITHKLDI